MSVSLEIHCYDVFEPELETGGLSWGQCGVFSNSTSNRGAWLSSKSNLVMQQKSASLNPCLGQLATGKLSLSV